MECQKHLFSIDPAVHYLNCAYMSPMLRSVEEAGIAGIRRKRDPYKVEPADFFKDSHEIRNQFSQLVGGDDPLRVSIIPATSYGMAIVSKNISLNAGDEILVLEGQFPSNYYTWERAAEDTGARVITIEEPEGFPRGKEWNERILESINDRTRLVAVPHVHWADGTLFDLISIRRKTDEVGAYLVVDGTQSVGALPFDVKEIRPDALVCSGYKWLMGPYSIALAWLGDRLLDGVPLEENWINRKNSEDFAGLVNYRSDYQPGALRYDVGERSNFIILPMMLDALRQINSWGVHNIHNYIQELATPAMQELSEMGYMVESGDHLSCHLFGVRKAGFDPAEFSRHLSDARVYVSVRGNAVRVAVNVFNDENDMRAFLDVCRLFRT